jgi:hypothetical protein
MHIDIHPCGHILSKYLKLLLVRNVSLVPIERGTRTYLGWRKSGCGADRQWQGIGGRQGMGNGRGICVLVAGGFLS